MRQQILNPLYFRRLLLSEKQNFSQKQVLLMQRNRMKNILWSDFDAVWSDMANDLFMK